MNKDEPVYTVSDYVRKYGHLPRAEKQTTTPQEYHPGTGQKSSTRWLENLESPKPTNHVFGNFKSVGEAQRARFGEGSMRTVMENLQNKRPAKGPTKNVGMDSAGSVSEIRRKLPENHTRGLKLTMSPFRPYGSVPNKKTGTFG